MMYKQSPPSLLDTLIKMFMEIGEDLSETRRYYMYMSYRFWEIEISMGFRRRVG